MVVVWLPGYIEIKLAYSNGIEKAVEALVDASGCRITEYWPSKKAKGLCWSVIQGKTKDISKLIASLEERCPYWDPARINVVFRIRKKGKKKNDSQTRAKAGSRSEGRNREGADSAGEHGEDSAVAGNRDSDRDPGFESDWQPEKEPGTDDDCD